jgi:prepilin-type N-terminal cleavage/methylation domain-containing protein/prepilin-type processing-associated H-X9-DG protein
MRVKNKKAFTLVELLVVMAIIALLMSVLTPALSLARARNNAIMCRSNIHQLLLANSGYATENNGYYVAAAMDMLDGSYGGLHRWHGVRANHNEPFEPRKGPLASYLGDGRVKQCPQKVNFRKGDPWDYNYEDGCGGYGYNMTYLGSRIWQSYSSENCRITAKDLEVRSPAETMMFADTAMARQDSGTAYYLEYSFIELPYFVLGGNPMVSWGYASPSLHFRHCNTANIGWVDGHISSNKMAKFDGQNAYGVRSSSVMLGWLDPIDNSLYDLH